MNSEEIKEEFNLASFQFDMRVTRLKRLFQVQACPPEFLLKEIELIQEAGKRLNLYSLPFNELVSKIPAIQGEKILKETMENIEREQFEDELDLKWLDLEKKYNNKYPGNNQVINSLIADLRENALLM